MDIYLYIGLFVGAINILWKHYLEGRGKLETPASVLTFLVASILWPFTIYVMIKKMNQIGW